jgi:hypothetical protein
MKVSAFCSEEEHLAPLMNVSSCAYGRCKRLLLLRSRFQHVRQLVTSRNNLANIASARTVMRAAFLLMRAGVQIGKRQEEERDMARYALRNPWWTLSNFDATRKATALQGDAKSVHWQLSEAATAASTASVTGFNYKEPKTEQEVSVLGMSSLWPVADNIGAGCFMPGW